MNVDMLIVNGKEVQIKFLRRRHLGLWSHDVQQGLALRQLANPPSRPTNASGPLAHYDNHILR